MQRPRGLGQHVRPSPAGPSVPPLGPRGRLPCGCRPLNPRTPGEPSPAARSARRAGRGKENPRKGWRRGRDGSTRVAAPRTPVGSLSPSPLSIPRRRGAVFLLFVWFYLFFFPKKIVLFAAQRSQRFRERGGFSRFPRFVLPTVRPPSESVSAAGSEPRTPPRGVRGCVVCVERAPLLEVILLGAKMRGQGGGCGRDRRSAGSPRSPAGRIQQHRPYKECNARANAVSIALAHFCH